MIPAATAAQTRTLDHTVIEGLGIAGRTLMEVAGRGVADEIHRRFPSGEIAVLCGPGNNGGDGYVAARWLHLWGRQVRLFGMDSSSPETLANRQLCVQLGLPFSDPEQAVAGADVAVDALLGTGQSQAPRGQIIQALKALSVARHVVAIDIPTGVHSDTGQNLGGAVQCALTLTIGRWKLGLLSAPGCALAGEVSLIDIGLDLALSMDPSLTPSAHILENSDIAGWWPKPADTDAKWDRGHVGILGSRGAATLAAHGAFRGGAGLVTLFAPKTEWDHFHGLWPEVIMAEAHRLDPNRHDVIVVGPGLGVEHIDPVLALWNDYPGGVVADADALTILANHKHRTPTDRARIITPHTAEAGRLLGVSRAEVEADRFAAMGQLNSFGTAVLKGPCTLIGPSPIWVNPRGSSRLATGGSGDVLAGMIGGLLAAGLPPEHAAACGAWAHGIGGERMPEGGTASDLVDALTQGSG